MVQKLMHRPCVILSSCSWGYAQLCTLKTDISPSIGAAVRLTEKSVLRSMLWPLYADVASTRHS